MNISIDRFKYKFTSNLKKLSAKSIGDYSATEEYNALVEFIKELVIDAWIDTNKNYSERDIKQVYYFSMEFLPGRFLISNLENLGIRDKVEQALYEMGIELDRLAEIEKEPALGNAGLGRLAAGIVDSFAAAGIPGHGCGIRFNYGMFKQSFVDGYQVELPDNWLEGVSSWEVKKAYKAVKVRFYGKVDPQMIDGKLRFIHHDFEEVLGVPYDVPVIGGGGENVNTLRLFSAEAASNKFDYESFSQGDYIRAFENKNRIEAISHVLYPNDSYYEGRVLRLKQEYFLASAGLQNLLRTFAKKGRSINELPNHVAIHLNDTHLTLVIPELMRILLDDYSLDWDEAFRITSETITYTNHTIMPEALENWEENLVKDLLPRIHMIIRELDSRFASDIPSEKENEMRIIKDGRIRFAYLSVYVSKKINGVAPVHTDILKQRVFRGFDALYPEKIVNVRNGISHRRWLICGNRKLSTLLDELIGSSWRTSPSEMKKLIGYRNDPAVLDKLDEIKLENKKRLADYIRKSKGIEVDPKSIFDVHVKRMHEYKRQLLSALHILYLYHGLKENPNMDFPKRTFIFAGKAASNYFMAKQIIKLINTMADVVNNDAAIKGKIKVVYLENYSVSLAEKIISAADVSEQISSVTKEASGTGNMKLMMNGALGVMTYDGSNLDIIDAVGAENSYGFGSFKNEVLELLDSGSYYSRKHYDGNEKLRKVIDSLTDGSLGVSEMEFAPIRDSLLLYNDTYLVLRDFDAYREVQERVSKDYRDKYKWLEKSLVNIAMSGDFSIDYTSEKYAREIWGVIG